MLHFINTDLFYRQYDVDGEQGQNSNIESSVLTAPKVLRGAETVAKRRLFIQIMQSSEPPKTVPFDLYANICRPSRQTGKSGNGYTFIDLNTNNSDSYVVLVALPFNGFANPIPVSNDYRIHKGMLVQSDKKNILCNGNKYKKVLYLLVEVNAQRFSTLHKQHTDELKLEFSSYNLETLEDSVNTVKTTSVVTFTSDGCTYTEASEYVEPVDANDFVGKPIYTVYKGKESKSINLKEERSKKSYTDGSNNINEDDVEALQNKFLGGKGKKQKSSGRMSHKNGKRARGGKKY